MASSADNASAEEDLPKSVRITTTLDYIDAKIVENLQGAFGNSQSSVIAYIVKEWIKSNSNMLRGTYGIDIAGIRREIQSAMKGEPIEKEVEERVFEDLMTRFKRIKRYNIEKLAELISVHPQTLIDIITLRGDELEEQGLNLLIDGEFVVKE
ncbi:MAG: hypothetical protein ACOC44_13010 [Promethearchaeia archaeon]